MKSFKNIFDSLPEDDQKIVQSHIDSRVFQGIKKSHENIGILPNALNRLKAIEDATNEKINKLELDKIILKECYAKGIDYELITDLKLSFIDEDDVSTKLDLLSQSINKKRVNDFNTYLVEHAYRPQSGKMEEFSHSIKDQLIDKLSIEEKLNYERRSK